MNYRYPVSLAGIPFYLDCRYSYRIFNDFLTAEKPLRVIPGESSEEPAEYLTEKKNAFLMEAELSRLIERTGSVLLEYDRCIFHGTAFIWHQKAWIFTAPSGTGKSTQYVLWKDRYGNELSILNGDKPILEFGNDESVTVHPSPWKGKERMGTLQSAPLGGIIYLRQGIRNCVERLQMPEAAVCLYQQFLFDDHAREHVDRVCDLETRLLRRYPVWELINLGNRASAELMHDTLLDWEIAQKQGERADVR